MGCDPTAIQRRVRRVLRRLEDWLPCSTAYALAIFAHVLVGVLLSLAVVQREAEPEALPVELSLRPTAELLRVDAVQEQLRQRETLRQATQRSLAEAPPLEPLDAPELGSLEGPSCDAAAFLGLGGGGRGRGGGRGGGGGGGAGGPSAASEAALDAALEWLVRHRSRDGGWNTVPAEHARTGALLKKGNVARTGLAVLCFLCAGHGPAEPGPYREVVAEGIAWLVREVKEDGSFRRTRGRMHRFYEQAIGTLALAEALQRARSPQVAGALARAVAYVERVQEPGRGWRYDPRRDTDTSVTSWMVLALEAAKKAGNPVSPAVFAGVRAYLREVSSPTGTTGYMKRRAANPAMNATGLFLRLVLEPGRTPAERAARVEEEGPAIRRVLEEARLQAGVYWNRRYERRTGIQNLYQIYYAALALHQVGGRPWERLNLRMRDQLPRLQLSEGCEAGSFPGGGRLDESILATTFATLILETYYRYGEAAEGAAKGAPERPEPPPPSRGEQLLDEALAALSQARRTRSAADRAQARETSEAALEVLRTERRSGLVAEALAALVEVAALGGEPRATLRRIEDYLRGLPRGRRADPAILRVRRVESVRALFAAVAELQPVAGSPDLAGSGESELRAPSSGTESELRAPSSEAESTRRALVLARRAETTRALLTAELPQLPGVEAEETRQLLARVASLQTQLLMRADPARGLARARELLGGLPPRGALAPAERCVAQALLERALRRFLQAQALRSVEALGEAESARAELGLRRFRERLLAQASARDPLRGQLGRLELLRARVLMLHEQARAALRAVERLRSRWPAEAALGGPAAEVERAALLALANAGEASPDERARLAESLLAWSRARPDLPPAEALALGEALSAAERGAEARALLERALKSDPRPERALCSRLHLALARLAREADEARAVHRHLLAVRSPVAERLDVRRLWCWLHRAQGRPELALREYLSLLRAFEEERPPVWWELSRETARAYAEAGRLPAARAFLEQLRVHEPELGGPDQREAMLELMRELDVAR